MNRCSTLRLWPALILILFVPAMVFADKNRLAVMDFRADGISKNKALQISELIRSEIINTGAYTVIERNQMDMVFKEQGIQQTGVINDAYAIKVGEMLSAQKILIGTAMKLGDSIIISGRIVDIEKGIAEFAVNQSAANENELLDATKLFCKKITGMTSQTVEISGRKKKKKAAKKTTVKKTTPKAVRKASRIQTSKKEATIQASVKPSKKVYAPYEQIILNFSNFPGKNYDWVSLAKPKEPSNYYQTYAYTGYEVKNGKLVLNGLESGEYEIRYYYNWENGKYDYHVMGSLRVAGK